MYSLNSGDSLDVGQQLTSENGEFVLRLQYDGNLVLYRVNGAASWPLWSTGTTEIQHLRMQVDGNLVGVRDDGTVVFKTGTHHKGSWLVLQGDGNVVVWGESDDRQIPQWSTGPAPAGRLTDRLHVGEAIMAGGERLESSVCDALSVQHDGNAVFADSTGRVILQTGTHGTPAIRLQYQADGNLVLVDGFGHAHWASKTTGQAPTAVSVDQDGVFSVGPTVLVRRRWNSPGCSEPNPPSTPPTETGTGTGTSTHTPVPSYRLTIIAKVGTLDVDPNMTPAEQQGLSVERFRLVTTYSTLKNAEHQRPQGTLPSSTLQRAFPYDQALTANTSVRLEVDLGVPGSGSQIAVTAVHPAYHVQGDLPDEFRYALGAKSDIVTIEVDWGSRPDGLVGWRLVPKVS